jgi:acyl-CoA thioester hydrolase
MNKEHIFRLEFSVRDYECDLQGIVNNAIYLHYLEYARCEFLVSRGLSFADLHNKGTDLIVTRVEIDYKYPLRSGDMIVVTLNMKREGNVRLIYEQEIFRLPDEKLIASAKVTGIATKNGRPVKPDEVIKLIGM